MGATKRKYRLPDGVAELHGRQNETIHAIFKTRGWKTLGNRPARVAATRRAHLDAEVARMHADYEGGLSLAAVGRK